MKRILSIFLACVLLLSCFSFNTFAASSKELQYEVSVGGENEVIVQAGEEITVDLYLNNITDGETYTVTGLQNEIKYDKNFFEVTKEDVELVEGKATSASLATGSLGSTRVRILGNTLTNGAATTFENKQLLARVTFKVKDGLANGSSSTLENTVLIVEDAFSAPASYPVSTQNMTVYIGEKPTQTYTITYKDGNDVVHTENKAGMTQIHTALSDPNKRFTGWKDTSGKIWQPGETYTVTKNMTFTAVWIGRYTLSFNTNGGTPVSSKAAWGDETISLSQFTTSKTGATFAGWYKDSGLTQKITSIKLTEDTTVYAKWTTSGGGATPPGGGGPAPITPPDEPDDSGKEHKAYILGYGDGTFKADNHMSRAEAATIFARLIAEEKGETVSGDATFSDVSSESWYDDYIGYLEKYNIVNGYADGSFRPNNTVTRAEFVVMAVRYYSLFNNVSKGNYTASYPDIQATHWAYADIAYADNANWINGYADGTFRGNNNITRAEVVTIVNKATNRVPDKEYIDNNLSKLNTFADLKKNAHWAYYAIMEAANTHTATTSNGVETWVK